MLIFAAVWLFRKDQIDKTIKDIVRSRGLLALSGWMSLILGLAIAIQHPIWQLGWRGLITLLGYLMIVKGVFRLGFTDQEEKYTLMMVRKGYWALIALLVVLGAFLTYNGFALH